MKRRFPAYVLLLIALVSACSVLLIAQNYKIPPTSTELWMDLYSGQMEFRYSWWDMYRIEERPVNEWWNRLSQDYLNYVGPFPKETEWVMINRNNRWQHGVETELYKYRGIGIEFGQRGVSNWLKCAGKEHESHELRPPIAGFTNSAKREYILRYLQVARTSMDDEVLNEYRLATTGKLWNLDRPVEVDDLIDVDDFLSDPRRERYYDPESLE